MRSALVLVLVALLPAPAAAAPERDTSWRDVLSRLTDPSWSQPYVGTLVVVSFVGGTPSVSEVGVTSGEDGTLASSRASAWVVGRRAGEVFLGDVSTGRILRADPSRRSTFSLARLARNYDITVVGERRVAGLQTTLVELRPEGAPSVRERLYVEPEAGLLLRRETYGDDGEPVRLAAFTEVTLTSPPEEAMETWEDEREPVTSPVTRRGVDILRAVGWTIPGELPGGFILVHTAAIGDEHASALHLLYSDGLYGLSVYQQHGGLDERSVRRRGAVPARLGDAMVHRWPVKEPATYVWDAEDVTFTVVSDAPPDVIGAAVSVFPHDEGGSLLGRLRRLLGRITGDDEPATSVTDLPAPTPART